MYVNIIYILKKIIVSTIKYTIDNVTIRNKCNFYNI